MPILLLSPRYSADSRPLAKAADAAGWDTERLYEWRIPEYLHERNDIAIYGEYLFGEFLQERLGVRLVDPPDDLLLTLPDDLRRRDVRLTRYSNARRETEPKFVKPPNFKSFKAAVYSTGTELPDDPDLSPTDVLVSEVVQWNVEFRCFILDGKIVDLSAYSRNGQLNATDDLRESWKATPQEVDAARKIAAAVIAFGMPLPVTCALDVGSIAGRGWAVVEANAAWGSGIYGCDPSKILPVLEQAVVNR